MNKIWIALILLCVVVPHAYAENASLQKFGRGVTNIVTAPVEIPKEIRSYWIKGSEKTYHILVWIFCGFVKGVVMTTARVGSGAWDVVSSPIAIPKDHQPFLKPNYVFQDWPQRKKGVIYKNLGEK